MSIRRNIKFTSSEIAAETTIGQHQVITLFIRATTLAEDVSPSSALNAVADALIAAHGHAVEEGDAKLLELIEGALLHVGRRLARESRKALDPIREGH